MKAIHWNEDDQGMTFEYGDIPADLQIKCEEMHEYLVESAAEASEELMDKYFQEGELSEEDIKLWFRQRTSGRRNHSGDLRFCIQEQRRSSHIGCRY